MKRRRYKTIAAVGIMNCMSAGYDTGFVDENNKPTAQKIFTSDALAVAFPASTVTVPPAEFTPPGQTVECHTKTIATDLTGMILLGFT